MVVFTCNHCGESLQKPKVAKHYQFQCRRFPDLCCVDCHKDFRGEEYVQHTKCLTENQRYGGLDYVEKPSANKGERKQNEWINIVQNTLKTDATLTPPERNFLNHISQYANIPRKKVKFMNFIRNSMGNRVNVKIVESVWDKMERAFKENKETKVNEKDETKNKDENTENSVVENQNNENVIKENEEDSSKRKKESKKRKLETENDDNLAKNGEENNDEIGNEKKKKKKRKMEVENGVEEDLTENIDSGSEKKKKSKKKKLDESNENANEVNEENVEKKKKKRRYDHSEMHENGFKSTIIEGISDNIESAENENNENHEILIENSRTKEEKKMKKLKLKEMSSQNAESEAVVDNEKNENSDQKNDETKKKSKSKKAKSESEIANTEIAENKEQKENERNDVVESVGKFDWKSAINEVINKSNKNLSKAKLQKKVVKSFLQSHPTVSQEKVIGKFEKALMKMKNVIIEDDIVKLLSN